MPAPYPHLSKAPIREAVLDLRCELPGGTTTDALAAPFRAAVADEYPDAQPMQQFQAQFGLKAGGHDVSTKIGAVGSIHWTKAHDWAVQCRIDGFAVNCVGAYDDWASFRTRAQRAWRAYLDAARPSKVQRAALLYVNRIEFEPGVNLDDLLRTKPQIGPGLDGTLADFFLRIALARGDERHVAVTQMTQRPESEGGKPALLMHVEAFSERTFDPGDATLWTELDALHDAKNAAFFESLQPKVWERYR